MAMRAVKYITSPMQYSNSDPIFITNVLKTANLSKLIIVHTTYVSCDRVLNDYIRILHVPQTSLF